MRVLSRITRLLALLSIAGFGSSVALGQGASTVVIDGVSVVDVVRGVVRAPMRVVIRNNRIVSVDRAPRTALPPPADTVIDGRGKFLIPGLWDMNVHIDTTESWFFPLSIAAGVTSVRDMGGLLSHVRRWKEPAPGVLRPTIVAAGPIMTG